MNCGIPCSLLQGVGAWGVHSIVINLGLVGDFFYP